MAKVPSRLNTWAGYLCMNKHQKPNDLDYVATHAPQLRQSIISSIYCSYIYLEINLIYNLILVPIYIIFYIRCCLASVIYMIYIIVYCRILLFLTQVSRYHGYEVNILSIYSYFQPFYEKKIIIICPFHYG